MTLAPKNLRSAASNNGGVSVQWDEAPGSTYEVTVQPLNVRYELSEPALALAALPPGQYDFVARNHGPAGKGPPDTIREAVAARPAPRAKPVSILRKVSWVVLGLIVLTTLGLAITAIFEGAPWYSTAIGALFVSLVLAIAHISQPSYGLWGVVLGEDQRLSTSKTQVFLWTLLVIFVIGDFCSQTWFGHRTGLFDSFIPVSGGREAGTGSSAWSDYVILLGGPFTALVLAKGIVTSKVQAGILQKPSSAAPALGQIVRSDSGAIDLVDLQYLVFNVVALFYVVAGLVETDHLPSIPPLLLALTGVGAATYAGNKAVQQNRPTITAVVPLSARPGDKIVITGEHLAPAGSSGAPSVLVGGLHATALSGWTDQKVVAEVPAGCRTGVASVSVTSAAGIASATVTMTVKQDHPEILSVGPPSARPGETVTVDGVDLISGLDGASDAGVLVGYVPPGHTETTTEHLGPFALADLGDGAASLSFPLPLDLPRRTFVAIAIELYRGKTTAWAKYRVG